jgi:hypothetical protein
MLTFFICYAREDTPWRDLIIEMINSISARTNIQMQPICDQDIPPGQDWDNSIKRMIDRASLCVLLGSQSFVNSVYIATKEERLILDEKGSARIFPVLITNIEAADAPQLRQLQWIPAPDGLASVPRGSAESDALLAKVRSHLVDRIRLLNGDAAAMHRSPPPFGSEADLEAALRNAELIARTPATQLPLLRISFERSVLQGFEVGVISRDQDQLSTFKYTIRIARDDQPQDIATKLFGNINIRHVVNDHLKNQATGTSALRLQICLPKGGAWLSDIAWEALMVGRELLGSDTRILFSRSIDFTDAEPHSVRVKPKAEFSLLNVAVHGQPNTGPGQWEAPFSCAIPANDRASSLVWTQRSYFTRAKLQAALRSAEVVCWEVPLGKATHGDAQFALPDAMGSLKAQSVSDVGAMLRELGPDQPTVFILPPLPSWNLLLSSSLAFELANAGVPIVIATAGTISNADWDSVLRILLEDLWNYDYIDAAVLRARIEARRRGFSLIVYVRVKSGRLWYEPGFSDLVGNKIDSQTAVAKIATAFARSETAPVACIGPSFSEVLAVSRNSVARTLAQKYAFSLSERDRGDLGLVAEYIQMSVPAARADGASKREHVSAFVEEMRRHILEDPEIFPPAVSAQLADAPIAEVVAKATMHSAVASEFELLGRLKCRLYLTVYFHDLIERAIVAANRGCTSTRFVSTSQGQSERVATPNLSAPAVYHCFGDFGHPDELLISHSDYFDLLAEHVSRSQGSTQMVASLLASSSLLIMGFSPSSFELRLLLSIIKRYQGIALSGRNVHVAVQIDPEDDHIVDNDRVKGYLRGMLSPLGDEIYIYWGSPRSFLNLLAGHPESSTVSTHQIEPFFFPAGGSRIEQGEGATI